MSQKVTDVILSRAWGDLIIMDDPVFTNPDFEQKNMDMIAALPWPADAAFVDVGGHQGIWSTFLATLRPQGTVVTFEPHPENCRYLLANLQRMACRNVTVVQAALGRADGDTVLRAWEPDGRPGTTGCHQLVMGDDPDVEYPVPLRRLDGMNLGRLDFMKIDVEHWELEVLAGAEETLRRCMPHVLVETHNADIALALRDFMVVLGYSVQYRAVPHPQLRSKSDYLWCVPAGKW